VSGMQDDSTPRTGTRREATPAPSPAEDPAAVTIDTGLHTPRLCRRSRSVRERSKRATAPR